MLVGDSPLPLAGLRSSVNSELTPDFKHRNIPVFIPVGAMSRSIMDEWLILSKHFSISSSITRFSNPFDVERRLSNRYFCALCAERPVLNP